MATAAPAVQAGGEARRQEHRSGHKTATSLSDTTTSSCYN